MTIDRRLFLKVTGAVAVIGVLEALPTAAASAPLEPPAPGMYQISGRVRLQEPVVTISGISNGQTISWTPGSLSTPVASFTSFERGIPTVQVTGGTLEGLQVTPIDFG